VACGVLCWMAGVCSPPETPRAISEVINVRSAGASLDNIGPRDLLIWSMPTAPPVRNGAEPSARSNPTPATTPGSPPRPAPMLPLKMSRHVTKFLRESDKAASLSVSRRRISFDCSLKRLRSSAGPLVFRYVCWLYVLGSLKAEPPKQQTRLRKRSGCPLRRDSPLRRRGCLPCREWRGTQACS
jgi:hypothetical protein